MPGELLVDTDIIRRSAQVLDRLAAVVRAGAAVLPAGPPALGLTAGSAPVRQATRATVLLACLSTELTAAMGDHLAGLGSALDKAAAAFDRVEDTGGG